MENPTEKTQAGPLCSGDLFGIWVPTAQRQPENPPGFPKDDHVACLCVWKFEMRILQWNAYYKVWDDAEGDDFFCAVQDVTHWMPLPPWPNDES
jgi:hypothetical protein